MEDYVHKKISSIIFGIFSPKMVKKMATAKIVTPELYDKEGYPVDGGLMDIRLGVIDPGLKCKTCGSKLKECIGHFGYIELARPVIHIKFVDIVLNLLRCTCKECGRVLIPKNKMDKNTEELQRVEEEYGPEARRVKIKEIISSLKTINKCPYCKTRQHKIALEKPTIFLENEKRITPIEIRSRLEKIPDDDLSIFGINSARMRPEWVVLTVLSIPPVTMRPSITLESGERSEDDLTHKLGDIVRINQRLFENINAGAPEIIIEDLWDLLQYHVTTFFDNNVPQLPPARHRSGQPLKGLTERIKSKEGRIRHNLAGKRTNFSARTVISPDPRIRLNEVGIPKSVAMKLTVPEVVNEWNSEYVKAFVERGPAVYPGSNYIVRPDGRKKKITDETKEQLLEELQPGFVVERHMMDGDICIFNRQPSLHRMSMMCHRARILPYKTFRLNPLVCTPYNADFDGDEMNIHVPQTEEGRAEAEILMEVQTQLISPRFGLSIIGCTQDAISGNYLLTQDWFVVSRQKAVRMLANAGVMDFSKLPDKKTVTGREIFSVILPNDFNYSGFTKKFKPGMEDKIPKKDRNQYIVTIKDGVLIEGVMDKANLGEGQGLLLRNLHKKYGQDKMVDFIGKIFKLGVDVLFELGFTTSISDIDVSQEASAKIAEIIDNSFETVNEFIKDFREGKLEPFPGKTMSDTVELKILEVLNKARNSTGQIVSEHSSKKTGSFIMADSGARGSLLNMAQMTACVGQQALRGSRINRGYSGRTLPSFNRQDLGPAAHGFVKGGFRDGLKPYEFFFQAMTGRDSLMDTALRTPKSGYLYRRLANALQDLKVEYDGTVREASDRVIQFAYGEDSVDVSKSEGGRINVKKIIDRVMGGA